MTLTQKLAWPLGLVYVCPVLYGTHVLPTGHTAQRRQKDTALHTPTPGWWVVSRRRFFSDSMGLKKGGNASSEVRFNRMGNFKAVCITDLVLRGFLACF